MREMRIGGFLCTLHDLHRQEEICRLRYIGNRLFPV